MEQTSKYFLQTAEALQNLQQAIAELKKGEENTNVLIAAKSARISGLEKIMTEQANRIDNIIQNLNGAIE